MHARHALPPGSRLPGALQFVRWVANTLPYLEELGRSYGDIFTMRWPVAGTTVIVTTPELTKRVFTADPDTLKAGEANKVAESAFGTYSMTTLDGAEHMRQRRLLLPSFHGERMQAYAETMREIAEASIDRWPLGVPFALYPQMQAITLDVILKTVFGVDEGARFDQLRRKIIAFLDSAMDLLLPLLGVFRLNVFELAPWLARSKLKRELDTLIYAEIARRRKAPRGGIDVLSMMLEARDDQGQAMTDVELRDELFTLLLAGHETTATSLAWTFERLLATPASLERLQEELATGRDEYLDAVVKETLRMRPIVPLVGRVVAKPFELGGYTIPVGVRVMPCIYLMHRRPDLYPEPQRFLPERWLGVKPDPYTWLPFGGGIRRCIGMAFAMFEMRVVLRSVLSRARLRPTGGRVHTATRGFTLVPSDGTQVVLVDRRRRAETAAALKTG
jgi:cytochrome P450